MMRYLVARKDRSRIAVETAAGRASRAIELMKDAMPFGPDTIQMTPAELKRTLVQNRQMRFMDFIDTFSTDDFMNIMREREQRNGLRDSSRPQQPDGIQDTL